MKVNSHDNIHSLLFRAIYSKHIRRIITLYQTPSIMVVNVSFKFTSQNHIMSTKHWSLSNWQNFPLYTTYQFAIYYSMKLYLNDLLPQYVIRHLSIDLNKREWLKRHITNYRAISIHFFLDRWWRECENWYYYLVSHNRQKDLKFELPVTAL